MIVTKISLIFFLLVIIYVVVVCICAASLKSKFGSSFNRAFIWVVTETASLLVIIASITAIGVIAYSIDQYLK